MPPQSCCFPMQKDLPKKAELAWQVSRYLTCSYLQLHGNLYILWSIFHEIFPYLTVYFFGQATLASQPSTNTLLLDIVTEDLTDLRLLVSTVCFMLTKGTFSILASDNIFCVGNVNTHMTSSSHCITAHCVNLTNWIFCHCN